MRLSDAIRAGANLRPQCFWATAINGKSCANMAAAEALGFPYRDGTPIEAVLGFLKSKGHSERVLERIIIMNDDSCMTRERIADWVEREYESKLPQKQRETDEAYARRMVKAITQIPVEA